MYVVSLNVHRRPGGPILLTEGGRLRIKGRVDKPGEVTFGLGAANRDRRFRDRFVANRRVESDFDIEIPVAEFRQHGGDDSGSAAGLEFFAWFCWAREPGLKITHVELLAP